MRLLNLASYKLSRNRSEKKKKPKKKIVIEKHYLHQ